MDILLSSLFWFALAVVFACVEIEAEGKNGWAENMPTWYRTTGLAARVYGILMGGKPLTGYHTWMFFLPVMIFHAPFVQGVEWTVQAELSCWAMYFAWCPLWDYLWFVLNPHYTFKNFRKENVWWHGGSPWILNRMPLDHLIAWAVSVAIAALTAQVGEGSPLKNHLCLMGLFAAFTIAAIIAAPLYHRWYKYMRRMDEREKAPIRHVL